jgi:hypothetical protein
MMETRQAIALNCNSIALSCESCLHILFLCASAPLREFFYGDSQRFNDAADDDAKFGAGGGGDA